MPPTGYPTSDLIHNGEHERAWRRHCGFLELSLPEAMAIQHRLMEEQFAIAHSSSLWSAVFPRVASQLHVDNFRSLVPLTDYADYAACLSGQAPDVLGAPISFWARTSGRGGAAKWVPYTRQMHEQLGDSAMGATLLGAARWRGDVRIRPHDVYVTNLPPRPYISGWIEQAVGALFDFRFVPALDESEQLSFQDRTNRIFQRAMVEGMDELGAMTIVLVRMGEAFANGANPQRRFTPAMLDPRLLWRVLRAKVRARRAGRNMLPRDLWSPKCLQCGGTDTSYYREAIKRYWGVYPHETYACTEVGLLATQLWDHDDMTFIPSCAFLEFIPAAAWEEERLQGTRPTETRLLDELAVGERYEVVVSSFKGGPFLRYRMHDLVEVTALENRELGVRLPQFRFAGRSGDFIDLSGFAGLIDERQVMTALASSGVEYTDWAIAKELANDRPFLHLYMEPAATAETSAEDAAQRLHAQLAQLNSEYADVETMLGYVPLQVTWLARGTFGRYVRHQVEHGAELAHLKPTRIQPSASVVRQLLDMSGDAQRG